LPASIGSTIQTERRPGALNVELLELRAVTVN